MSNLPVLIPSSDGGIHYITIPVSWGLKPIKVMFDGIMDAAAHKGSVEKMARDVFDAAINSYNPVGGTDALSAMVPSVLDTPVDIGRNLSWSGSKIKPDSNAKLSQINQYWSNTPDTLTGKIAVAATKFVYDKSNKRIDISPEDVIYAYEQLVGGAGKAATRVASTATSAIQGEMPQAQDIPFLNRFYKDVPEDRAQSNAGGVFNDRLKTTQKEQANTTFELGQKAKALDAELSRLSKEEANQRVQQIKTEDPLLYKRLIKTIKDRKLGLDWQEKSMKSLGVANGARAQFIHQTIKEDYDTPEGRNAYFKELKDKKIITPEVAKQIAELVATEKVPVQ